MVQVSVTQSYNDPHYTRNGKEDFIRLLKLARLDLLIRHQCRFVKFLSDISVY